MESGLPPPPLPRSYDDVTVFLLEPLHDSFIARELEQRRFSKTQEGEWIARIAKDVRRNERAVRVCLLFVSFHSTRRGPLIYIFKTDAVKRWLKAISLSTKREFCNFVPPLTDEAFQLFVQFFWLIKASDWRKSNQLIADARRQWGLETCFDASTANKFLESGDDTAFSAAAVSSWTRYQAPRFTGKGVSKISVL
jgi:hypothetical protein